MNDQKEVSLTFKNTVTGTKDLEKYEKQLESIYSLAQGMKNEKAAIGKMSITIRNVNNEVAKTTRSVNIMAKSFNLAFALKSITTLGNQLKRLATSFANLSQQSVNYIENVNLLEVAYKNSTETIEESSARIEEYIDKMSEVYGLDASNLTRQFGVFKQMANAMQLPVETGEHLSELMVKMTNDIASLYNLSLERSSNALQSALVGQTRPIRGATGADITEKTLQNTVDQIGLDRSIKELSYVEKRLIMVVSLTNQLKVSQGDYARTIESASNQIRIMKEQWNALSRAVGNIFYGVLQTVMPYVNGLLMALTEIANVIATLLGFEMPEFDYSSLSGTSDAAMDIIDGLDGVGDSANNASKGVDNLKKKMSGLRSFDALNVINTPTSSTSGGTGGSVSGSGGGFKGNIDPKIMDAFNKAFGDYNDMMDKVKLKAHDIRDTILEWLGFHKVIDGLTKETVWKFEGWDKLASNIWKAIKKIPTPIKLLASAIGAIEIAKLVKHLQGIKALLSDSGILGFVKGFFTPLKTLKSSFVDAFNSTSNSGMGVANTITSINKGFTNWAKSISKVDAMKVSIMALTTGFVLFKDALNDAGEMTTGTFLKMEAGIASMQFGFATLASNLANSNEQIANFQIMGSSVGQLAGPIGMLVGSFVGLFTAIKDGLDSQAAAYAYTTDAGNKYKEALDNIHTSVVESIDLGMAHITYCEDLQTELMGLVDANGKIKEGNEERAKQITGVLNKTLGTQLTVEGKVLKSGKDEIKSKQDLQKEIQKTIEKKKMEIAVNATQAQYEKTLQKQIELKKDLTSRQERYNYMLELFQKDEEAAAKQYGISVEEYRKSLDRQKQGLESVQQEYDKYNKETENYRKVQEAAMTGDMKNVDKYLKEIGIDMKFELDEVEKKTTNVVEGSSSKVISNADKIKTELRKKFTNWSLPKATVEADIKKPKQTELDKFAVDFNTGLKKYGFNFTRFNAEGGMFKNGVWSPITNYATGGLPSVGQMFVAREAGPELVGKIGNGTAVMNNNQIVDSVASGVYKAVVTANKTNSGSGRGTQVFNIYLDDNNKLATYTLEQLQEMATTNGKPIRIGG